MLLGTCVPEKISGKTTTSKAISLFHYAFMTSFSRSTQIDPQILQIFLFMLLKTLLQLRVEHLHGVLYLALIMKKFIINISYILYMGKVRML